MPFLQQSLYVFSNALLIPIVVGVIVLAGWTLLMLGGLLREWLGRGEVRKALKKMRGLVKDGAAHRDSALYCLRACHSGLPARLAVHLGEWPGAEHADKCLEDLELDAAASLARFAWVTRVAPMLGLMGTLIPMGPALNGLASGDLAALSSNLVLAFTTTIAGVFVGCAAFSINLVRKTWYNRDMSDLDYVFERLSEHNPCHEEEDAKVG